MLSTIITSSFFWVETVWMHSCTRSESGWLADFVILSFKCKCSSRICWCMMAQTWQGSDRWLLFIMVTACDVIVHLKICCVVRTCTTDKAECCNATVIQQVCTLRGVCSQNDWDHPVLWNLTGRANTVLPKKIFSHLRQCRCAIEVIVKATE